MKLLRQFKDHIRRNQEQLQAQRFNAIINGKFGLMLDILDDPAIDDYIKKYALTLLDFNSPDEAHYFRIKSKDYKNSYKIGSYAETCYLDDLSYPFSISNYLKWTLQFLKKHD